MADGGMLNDATTDKTRKLDKESLSKLDEAGIDQLVRSMLRNPLLEKGAPIKRRLIQAFLVIGGLSLVFLLLRALGAFEWLPSPWGLRKEVYITARDLEAGQVLQLDEIKRARLIPRKNDLKVTDDLDGVILANRVLRSTPLKYEDLQRLQVVTINHLAAGETITREKIKLEWQKYQPDAAVRFDEVVNYKAKQAIHSDYVILKSSIEPVPKLAKQVVAGWAGLASFQVIKPADVTIREIVQVADGFDAIDNVVDHYTTVPLRPGVALQRSQVSANRMLEVGLEGRLIIPFPICWNKSAIAPPGKVSLFFRPRDPHERMSLNPLFSHPNGLMDIYLSERLEEHLMPCASNDHPLRSPIRQTAIILALDNRSTPAWAVVVMREDEARALRPLLKTWEVSILPDSQ